MLNTRSTRPRPIVLSLNNIGKGRDLALNQFSIRTYSRHQNNTLNDVDPTQTKSPTITHKISMKSKLENKIHTWYRRHIHSHTPKTKGKTFHVPVIRPFKKNPNIKNVRSRQSAMLVNVGELAKRVTITHPQLFILNLSYRNLIKKDIPYDCQRILLTKL